MEPNDILEKLFEKFGVDKFSTLEEIKNDSVELTKDEFKTLVMFIMSNAQTIRNLMITIVETYDFIVNNHPDDIGKFESETLLKVLKFLEGEESEDGEEESNSGNS